MLFNSLIYWAFKISRCLNKAKGLEISMHGWPAVKQLTLF